MEKANLSYIKNLSGGDLVFENKIIEIIKNEFPSEKEIYFNSLEEKENLKTVEIVHKLKHKISILGLEKSYEVAVEYENDLKKDIKILEKEFKDILQNMTDFINKI